MLLCRESWFACGAGASWQIKAEARDQKLRRKCGHETLGKMDLVDLMDLMDMPQWQQNQPQRHACPADGFCLTCRTSLTSLTKKPAKLTRACTSHHSTTPAQLTRACTSLPPNTPLFLKKDGGLGEEKDFFSREKKFFSSPKNHQPPLFTQERCRV